MDDKIEKLIVVRSLFNDTIKPLLELSHALYGFGEEKFEKSRKEIKEIIGDFQCCIHAINKHIEKPPQ